MISTNKIVFVDGTKYYGAKALGFNDLNVFVISMYTTSPESKPCGTFFTTIPLSQSTIVKKPLNKVIVQNNRVLLVLDDWGYTTRIVSTKKVIDELYKDCCSHIVSLSF